MGGTGDLEKGKFKFIQKFKTLAKKRDWPAGSES